MDVQATVRQAVLLRWSTFAPGDVETKRVLAKVRRGITAALQPMVDAQRLGLLDGGGFHFDEGQGAADETVTLSFSSQEWSALQVGVMSARWPTLNETMEEALFGLLDLLKEWPQQARALEDFERLPENKRKQVLDMQKRQRKPKEEPTP